MKKSLLFILATLIILGIFSFSLGKQKAPPLDNYTVSKLCPDGVTAREYVSADGKKTIKKRCPEGKIEVKKWPCDPLIYKC